MTEETIIDFSEDGTVDRFEALTARFHEDIHRQVRQMVINELRKIMSNSAKFNISRLENALGRATDNALAAGTLTEEIAGDPLFTDLLEHYIDEENLFQIGETGDVTTQDMLQVEKQMVADAGRLNRIFRIDKEKVDRAIAARETITDEQITAARAACETANQVTIIEGTAGAGKSFTMDVVCETYVNEGYEVMGTAVSWNAAKVLGNSIKSPNCFAMAGMLQSIDAAEAAGYDFFQGPTLLIVDEAGMVGTVAMAKLLRAAARSRHPVKVVLTGDSLQVNPVDAGNALELLVEFHGSSRINKIFRQKQQSHRDIVYHLSRRESGQALYTILHQERLRFCRNETEMMDRVVQDFISYRVAHPDRKPLILGLSNDVVNQMNARVREVFKKLGWLGRKEYRVEVTDTLRQWSAGFSVGDEVVLRATGKNIPVYEIDPDASTTDETQWRQIDKGVYNRNSGVIVGMRKARKPANSVDFIVDLGGDQPGRVIINSKSYKAHKKKGMPMVHNFATTIYGSQGQTVDSVFLMDSPMMDFRLAYVGASRHRHNLTVYANLTELSNRMERGRGKSTPANVEDPDPQYGQLPKEFAIKMGNYTQLEYVQAMAVSWGKDSQNPTALMHERRKRLAPKEKARRDAELAALRPTEGEEIRDYNEYTNEKIRLVDVAAILRRPYPLEDAEMPRESEADRNSRGLSLTEMDLIQETPQHTPPGFAGVAGKVTETVVNIFNQVFSGPQGSDGPMQNAVVSESGRLEDPPDPFASSRTQMPDRHIKIGNIPFIEPEENLGTVNGFTLPDESKGVEFSCGTVDFTGVPCSRRSLDLSPSDDFMASVHDTMWTVGPAYEPRVLACTPGTKNVRARYRMNGQCIAGDAFPPMLMNPSPKISTPIVIVAGPKEMFLMAEASRKKYGEGSEKIPHVVWAAKGVDWKYVAKGMAEKGVTIVRSPEDPDQEQWARVLRSQLSDQWGIPARITPPLPEDVLDQIEDRIEDALDQQSPVPDGEAVSSAPAASGQGSSPRSGGKI